MKQILAQPENQELLFGDVVDLQREGFRSALRQSFLGTLVQSLHDRTLDLKEYLRMGREVWPRYSEPLEPSKINRTLAVAKQVAASNDTAIVQGEILSLLDRKFLPQMRSILERGSIAPSVHEFPSLQKYALLAAYLCQVNRPDKDRKLFSIEKNGRKRRATDNADEEGAFGLAAKRVRTFPVERMLSVFVSVVGLHSTGSDEERIRSLGSTAFFGSLAELREMGLVLGDARRCWCSLSASEAQGIAKSLNFPLDKYML